MKVNGSSRVLVIAGLFLMATIGMVSADTVYTTDFSTDPATDGWTGFAASQWEWGVATASSGCGGSQDPAVDNSPSSDNYIVGYDIGGCYTNSISEINLTSPAFDCSAYAFVFVDFYRWLGVESATYDHASVRVSTNGSTWTTVWDFTDTTSFSDSSWTHINYDISAIAGGQSAVQVRFVMGLTDTSVVYCGWNIDDFSLIGGTSGTLAGTVTDDTKAPIEGATVTVVGSGDSAVTIADGTYTMPVLSGTYEVTCLAAGYNSASVSGVVVVGGSTTTQDFVLTYPDIDVNPTSFDVTLPVGGTQDEILTISNDGNGDLDYMISITPPQTREVGNWTDMTPIATAVQWPASCFGEGIFFVAGGFTDITAGTIFSGIQMYNTATGTWTTSANVPTPLFSGTAAYYDGKVYLCGGYINDAFGATNKTQIYDIATDTWTQGATMPTARGGCSGGIIGSKIYALGGSPDSNFPTDNVAYEYDIPTNTWATKTNGPINTYGISLGGGCALNGKIYTGGHFSSSYYQFYSYDPAADTWTTLPSMPPACGGQTVSLLGLETEGFVLAVGGGYDWSATGTTFKFDPATNTWTNLSKPMTETVLGGGCAAGYGTIFFYGGTTGSGPVSPAPFMSTTFNYITWVSANPISGTIPAGNSEQVTVHFDADAAGGFGDFEAWIVVGSNDGDENPLNIPAIMHVSGGPTSTPTTGPTSTPTPEPTNTPTEPTATPTPVPTTCTTLGTTLELSQTTPYMAGDVFWLKCHVCNNTATEMTNVPTAVILAVYGSFFFYPSWGETFQVEMMNFPAGQTDIDVFTPFDWPTVEGSATGLEFYSAMLTPEMNALVGNYGYVSFGYGN